MRAVGRTPDFAFDFRFGNGGKIVGHYHRVGEQAGLFALRFGEINGDPAWMVGAEHPARNHSNHRLRQPGLQIIRLNQKRRSRPGCDQIGMREEYENDVPPGYSLDLLPS